MTTPAPPLYVEAPATVPHKFGILSVAVPRKDGDKWQLGIEFEPAKCTAASLTPIPTCEQYAADASPAKTYDEGVPLDDADPFTVYGSFSCSPVGNWSRAEERARQHLRTGRERAIESAVESGLVGASPSLNSASTVDVTPSAGVAVDVVTAVGLLEQWIAANTTGGVLHVSPLIASWAIAAHLLIEDGPRLYTKLGTPVIVGAGYTGQSGPNADVPDPGDYWAFASGTPQAWLGEEFLTSGRGQSLDTRTNDLEILAEQVVLVAWACGTAAVLLNQTGA